MNLATTSENTKLKLPTGKIYSPSTKLEDIDKIIPFVNPSLNHLTRLIEERMNLDVLPQLRCDMSSVWPRFEIKNETSIIKEKHGGDFLEPLIELDVVVNMPPIKEWTAKVRIKKREKATLRIVDLEDY